MSYGYPISMEKTHLIPTPPAIKTTFRIRSRSIPDGGQTKLPPTLIPNSAPKISSLGLQSHALAGFFGASCTASSTYGGRPCASTGGRPGSSKESNNSAGSCPGMGSTLASAGVEVMLKPPALGMDGIWTSSHWPGRKVSGWGVLSSYRASIRYFTPLRVKNEWNTPSCSTSLSKLCT